MAITYPYYTSYVPRFWISNFPFEISNFGKVNGTYFFDSHLYLQSYTTNTRQLVGGFFFYSTTCEQSVDIDTPDSGTPYPGTSYAPHDGSSYSLTFKCYNSNGSFLGNVVAINKHIVYNVNKADTLPSGKMYNKYRGSKTCEPYMIRYASDTGANVYTPVTNTSASNSSTFSYWNRDNVSRSQAPTYGYQWFDITLLQGTAYCAVQLDCYKGQANGGVLAGSKVLYSTSNPIPFDTTSKGYFKDDSSTLWTKNAVVWYKKANSTTWEKKFMYKKSSNSTTWEKL